ncbi:hypothetical protein [Spiroplasma endosymbiont of Polydrusus formosus]|uniref:hypothetical protein n=1 Tax=Spiroplasma endosymbiont of Polydrusus formosus TaxID=3139326 RepID=UPI0035B513C9
MQEQLQNNFNKYKLVQIPEDSAFISLLGNGIPFKIYKQFKTNQDLSKIIKTKTMSSSKKFILNKIKTKRKQ